MDQKIKDLTLLFTDAELILQECRELKANLSLELQAVRDDRGAQYREFQELMSEVRNTLHHIQARFMVDARVLDLVRPDEDEEPTERETNGNRKNGVIRVNFTKPGQGSC